MSKKKPSRTSSSKNSAAVNKAASIARKTGSAAENVARMGTHAVHNLLATGAGEAQKAQDKVFAIGRESADKFARSTDAAAQGVNEAMAIGRDNIEACVEYGTMAADMTRTLSAEVLNFTNDILAQNVEISQKAMACRSFGDLLELQSEVLRHTLDSFFSGSTRMSEMMFEYVSHAAEPLNDRMTQVTERLSKVVAA